MDHILVSDQQISINLSNFTISKVCKDESMTSNSFYALKSYVKEGFVMKEG